MKDNYFFSQDAHDYIIANGWSWPEVEATARAGVADHDKEFLREAGNYLRPADLRRHCQAQVREERDRARKARARDAEIDRMIRREQITQIKERISQ